MLHIRLYPEELKITEIAFEGLTIKLDPMGFTFGIQNQTSIQLGLRTMFDQFPRLVMDIAQRLKSTAPQQSRLI
jgi:hypothetical protein